MREQAEPPPDELPWEALSEATRAYYGRAAAAFVAEYDGNLGDEAPGRGVCRVPTGGQRVGFSGVHDGQGRGAR
jgi:hypothetical protein